MAKKQLRVCKLSFDGHILRRGFWLYVWRVTSRHRTVLYVGRTGDSSSDFASSPFVRIGRHLDSRPTARSNSLHRHLDDQRFTPTDCSFEFVAFGPIFPEQRTTTTHRAFRDRTGALEASLANQLRARGFTVIGIHSSRISATPSDAAKLTKFINEHFPNGRNA